MSTSQFPTINFKVKRFATNIQYSVIAIVLISVGPSRALAQDGHSHMPTSQQSEMTREQRNNAGALVQIVRQSTERFKNVSAAVAEGYALQFGCVSGSDSGAMGLHYVNGDLVKSGVLDATRPQIVIYEPMPGGGLRLSGADYLLIADAWNATHSGPPELMGQLFHLFDAPNRFGLPAFYTLHVWAWKDNPNGAFVNWHPNVSCQSFAGQNP
ncbi:MAG: hypothetical protein QOJ99_3425 [Bryobacterales bacterium]|jgi:hypothetical protein|nr:hypothetical protein [Bryobacterales bacterium]